jgi:hypothetical protein
MTLIVRVVARVRSGDDVVRLLIEGSTRTEHIGSPLEDPQTWSAAAKASCTFQLIVGFVALCFTTLCF